MPKNCGATRWRNYPRATDVETNKLLCYVFPSEVIMSNGRIKGKKYGGLFDWRRKPTTRTGAKKRKSK